jgi:hypothetical protein
MTQHVGKFNPAKASYYERKATREQRDDTPYIEFREWAKTHSPKLYQKLKREDQRSAERDTYEFAHLDDPATLAMWDEAEAIIQFVTNKKHANEYALLGIEAGATKREVKNAYRRKARKLHPDVGGDAEAFKQMYAAYRELLKVTHD